MNVETVEATYENGVLKPKQPLALAEGAEVRLVISPAAEPEDPLGPVIGIGESGRTDGAEHHDRYLYGVSHP
ncbi:MAG TPA: antitoxin family protein [Planctomycetaceae bacterium]|nr:antitoxin family protein [Planctomycetaceae bacterium]